MSDVTTNNEATYRTTRNVCLGCVNNFRECALKKGAIENGYCVSYYKAGSIVDSAISSVMGSYTTFR